MPTALVFISGALASIGAPAFLQSAVAWLAIGASSFLGSALLSIGLSFGLNYLASAFMKPKAPRPEDVQNNIRNAISPRLRHYGRVKTGGTVAFIESQGGNLHKVLAMGYGLADAIEEVWIDSNQVVPDAGGWVQSAPYQQGNGSCLRIETRIGQAFEQPYADMVATFPNWTPEHRGDGILSLYTMQQAVKADQFQERFPNGAGTIYRLVVRGSKLFNPNEASSVITNPATWGWSDNLALVVLDYMHHRDGMRIPLSMLTTPLAMAGWQRAAAECHEPIELAAGGTESRYRLWGSYSLDERPADVLGRMLICGEGRIVPTRDGGITIDVGKWQEPTVTIDDTIIVSFDNLGRGRDILETANIINATYLSPDHDYQSTDAQPWVDGEDVSVRGEITTGVEFIMAPSHAQCRRLMKITADDANPEWVGSFVLNLRGLSVIGERFIRITYPAFGIDHAFKVKDARFLIGEGATLVGVQIDVTSVRPSAYAWTPEEEGQASASDKTDVDRTVPMLTGFTVSIIPQDMGGVTIAVARAQWTPPATDALAPQVEYKRLSELDWTELAIGDQQSSVTTGVLVDGEPYQFRARNRTLAGRGSAWTPIIMLDVVSDPVAPGPVTGLSGEATEDKILLLWIAPNSANYRATNIYRGSTNQFSAAVLVSTKWGAPSVSEMHTDDGLPAGTYYYWLKTRNGSGVESAAIATGPVILS